MFRELQSDCQLRPDRQDQKAPSSGSLESQTASAQKLGKLTDKQEFAIYLLELRKLGL